MIEEGIKDVSYAPSARVNHTADQSITSATWTSLSFNTEDWDTAANAASTQHDTVTNNNRLTAIYAGKYAAYAYATFAANATGQRYIGINKNTANVSPALGDFSAATTASRVFRCEW